MSALTEARAEQLYRDEMELHNVPAHLRDGLIRYLLARIRPGGFLCAVLADDAPEAFRRAAPDITVAGMAGLHLFLMGVAPANAWGSYEAIECWLDHGHCSVERHDAEQTLHTEER